MQNRWAKTIRDAVSSKEYVAMQIRILGKQSNAFFKPDLSDEEKKVLKAKLQSDIREAMLQGQEVFLLSCLVV